MKVNFVGKLSAKKRTMLDEAVRFFCNEMISPKVYAQLEVTIEVTTELSRSNPSCILGDTTWEDQNVRPREFTIRLASDIPLLVQLKLLGHECVHVKQYASGILQDMANGDQKWDGERFVSVCHDAYDLSYPWEIEAYGRETMLLHSFLSKTNRLSMLQRKYEAALLI